ncbi:unnamed protein product [Meloidogyne enterolobii]|uniref:Uncharacterized protein n=1 Tax=Meloidogyne enterolobii TaxID=390850 RepID=A0ACB1AAG0_MELEN
MRRLKNKQEKLHKGPVILNKRVIVQVRLKVLGNSEQKRRSLGNSDVWKLKKAESLDRELNSRLRPRAQKAREISQVGNRDRVSNITSVELRRLVRSCTS